ncbi:RNA polymerase sigma factor [Enterococcus sp. AD013-P3]|uniref:RNA polymerase sigma factor n=1 Tax=Enterococcus sp. AD013-P3 TaxID=3411036 RepID=UPI003B932A09
MEKDQLTQLYERYGEETYWYSLSLTKNREQAQELVSDAFFRLMTALDELAEEQVKFWLLRLIKNRFYDQQRYQNRWQKWFRLNGDKTDSSPATPLETLLADETKQQLYRGIEQLSANDRELLLLHYFNDWPVTDIASFLDLTYPQAKTRLYRARKRLKEVLEHDGFTEI